ncbi:Uncharacterized protein DBV15_07058 [Temnothorax longispinosus]|uniref:Uncharacterized protein n=1 Tax=Temnothorax longispinosus TaxID=300112 RepID=A0A4S2KH07_9HYME|nr:Uncharacterized protein DBV15_07058 [Temnothorax longispinosus]
MQQLLKFFNPESLNICTRILLLTAARLHKAVRASHIKLEPRFKRFVIGCTTSIIKSSAGNATSGGNLLDLETRLQNVNFEDPNELWSALSEAERQEFEALIKNGEAEKLLPKWPVKEDIKNAYSDLKYPALIDVPLFNDVQKASPCVHFNVTNVIYAYAYIALYYIEDYLNCAEEAACVFLTI